MIRRVSSVVAVALWLALAAPLATADVPPGPRMAIQRLDLWPPSLVLVTVGVDGVEEETIAGGDERHSPSLRLYDVPAWSPDGSRIAFSATPAPRVENPRYFLYLAAADGSGATRIPGTESASSPVFSPDGHSLAFARERERVRRRRNGDEQTVYASAAVWIADLNGGKSRQLTPWRNRLVNRPTSFSPDGKVLATTRTAGDKPSDAIGISFDGSADVVLAQDAFEPVFSPDGTKLAFLRGKRKTIGDITALVTDLYVKDISGGGLRQLTRTKRALEVTPRWDQSSQRISYTRVNPFGSERALLGFGDAIMQINPDGSCPTKILSLRSWLLYGAAWQPGLGREAGPLSC